MKNIIPFTKNIKFNTKIYELTSISLEHNLMVEDNNINGEFIVSGDYKINDTSINSEPFIYGLPFNISLDNKYNAETISIDIDDFKYEIINEEILRVDIDVLIQEDLEEIHEEIKPDVLIDIRNEERKENDMNEDLFIEKEEPVVEVNNVIDKINTDNDQYISYYVHIVRENDTIDSICNLYNTNIEDIKEYNNIDKIILGNKIIIPKNEAV
ncbi:MAG: LysM peptidoglycan-binding domain-containing protein [Bacilli bacterium]|nr:LysM peptidoglycan-binding domain-containing protein [Bacilli bacterium]